MPFVFNANGLRRAVCRRLKWLSFIIKARGFSLQVRWITPFYGWFSLCGGSDSLLGRLRAQNCGQVWKGRKHKDSERSRIITRCYTYWERTHPCRSDSIISTEKDNTQKTECGSWLNRLKMAEMRYTANPHSTLIFHRCNAPSMPFFVSQIKGLWIVNGSMAWLALLLNLYW